ncbi:acyl-ACP--UDP-N-acetylglucosamine O-acyltransferase [Termitidicoccus mucosus]|uniref:acyl-ACP--UDP-N-acetylglucosamine O-acyltransferase n=1 Tax=Termitidicoccus mucosus TaxID=1184151 RepID=UPI002FEE12BE
MTVPQCQKTTGGAPAHENVAFRPVVRRNARTPDFPMIHPTAIIEPGAQIGADCEIHAGAIIKRHVILGDRVTVHPYAVIGGDPQALAFDPAVESFVRIGAGTRIREHVTVNRSLHAGVATVVGENCFIMAAAHVAHDAVLGDNIVLANNVLLAGHVEVGTNAFLGGAAVFHQFTRIGEGVMVSGNSSITRDLAPYTLVAERDEVIGLNVVGLKRRGHPREAIRELKEAFHAVYFTPGNIREVAASALASGEYKTAEAHRFLQFFEGGKRSFARLKRNENLAGAEE